MTPSFYVAVCSRRRPKRPTHVELELLPYIPKSRIAIKENTHYLILDRHVSLILSTILWIPSLFSLFTLDGFMAAYPPPPHKPRALINRNFKLVGQAQRDQRGVASADCWNWGEWGHTIYKCKGSFLGGFVGLSVPVQETFILPLLLWSAQYKIFFSSPYTISIYVSPSPSNLGRQPCRAACLWMCVSGQARVYSHEALLLLYLFSKARAPRKKSKNEMMILRREQNTAKIKARWFYIRQNKTISDLWFYYSPLSDIGVEKPASAVISV